MYIYIIQVGNLKLLLDSLKPQYPTYCRAADRARFRQNQWIQLNPEVYTLSTSRAQIIGDISKQ